MAEINNKQKTIQKAVSLSGTGLHTGKEVTITFKPAAENTGYIFKRIDLEGEPEIPAKASLVTSTERGTRLEKGEVSVQTSEHVLAACVGLEIDNLLIELNAEEPPIMDGSSITFVEALEKAGIEEQEAERDEYVITEVISYKDEETGSEITLLPADEYEIISMVDFETDVLGSQNAQLKKISDFKEEIAKARTFVFLHELEVLLEHGLIKGGALDNAIVYVDKELSEETTKKLKKAFNKDEVSIRPNGTLDNVELYFPNEAARHKLLDIIGDLAIVGTRIRGKVIANKPEHKINTNFAKELEKKIRLEIRKDIPKIDLIKIPLKDVTAIQKMLP